MNHNIINTDYDFIISLIIIRCLLRVLQPCIGYGKYNYYRWLLVVLSAILYSVSISRQEKGIQDFKIQDCMCFSHALAIVNTIIIPGCALSYIPCLFPEKRHLGIQGNANLLRTT